MCMNFHTYTTHLFFCKWRFVFWTAYAVSVSKMYVNRRLHKWSAVGNFLIDKLPLARDANFTNKEKEKVKPLKRPLKINVTFEILAGFRGFRISRWWPLDGRTYYYWFWPRNFSHATSPFFLQNPTNFGKWRSLSSTENCIFQENVTLAPGKEDSYKDIFLDRVQRLF